MTVIPQTSARYLLSCLLLAAAAPSSAAQPEAVSYRLLYRADGDPVLHVEIALPRPVAGVHDLVMPRSIPMGYAVQHYDRFVRSVRALGEGGAALIVDRADGPRWRLRSPDGSSLLLVRVEYDVDVVAMELEILAGSDTSKIRPGYAGLLGYTVFGYLDGFESRPVRLEVRGPEGWPVLTTLAPAVPVPLTSAAASADDFYALADSQVLLGPGLSVERVETRAVPLFVAVYAEFEVDRARVAGMARRALEPLTSYFGRAPFAHYSICLEALRPPSPEHHYGFAMEHLSSSTYSVGDKPADVRGVGPGASAEDAAGIEDWIAHHIAHAWIPKRVWGEGYFPHTWEVPPVLDTIWFAEGFGQYLAMDAQAEDLPEAERAAYLERRVRGRFQSALATMPAFLLRMPLVQLSRVASTAYSDDFRTGRTVFSRGGLMAAEMDRFIRLSTGGRKRLRDALRCLVDWSDRERRGFRIDELPGLFAGATGVDTRPILEKWLGPYPPDGQD